MNTTLHHTVALARLVDLRRAAELDRRLAHRAPPPAREQAAPRARRTLRRRILRTAA